MNSEEGDFHGLLTANLERVFAPVDSEARLAAIREIYAPDATLCEPDAVAVGHDAIASAVEALFAHLPGDLVFSALGPAVGHHGVARLRWRAGPPGGPVAAMGTDVARIEDGRIRSLHVLLDPVSSDALAESRPEGDVSDQLARKNKALVLEAMARLFQRHESAAVDLFYAEDYVQHNPNVPQGREALKLLIATLPPSVYYEPGLIIAERDFVAIHGRIRGWAAVPQIVVDLFRIEAGKLAEHWDVMQNEVAVAAAVPGLAMFDPMEQSLTAIDLER